MANQNTQEQAAPANTLALVKKDTVDVVAAKVREFQERGEINFPANYSPENAMKSAWLALQNTQDKNKRPALEVCTKNSIANALLDMVVQGLNVAKKQGYFIVYGDQLVFQRSYFGTMAVTKQIAGAVDIVAQVIYEGDELDYVISGGRKTVIKHVQKMENVAAEKIAGAYCEIYFPDREPFTDVMTFEQIKKAWAKSQMRPITDAGDIKAGSTHADFAADMAIKTVVNHACKYYLNTSDDSGLVMEHFQRSDEAAQDAEIAAEIEENANGEIIELEPEEEPEEAEEPEEEAVAQAADGPGY